MKRVVDRTPSGTGGETIGMPSVQVVTFFTPRIGAVSFSHQRWQELSFVLELLERTEPSWVLKAFRNRPELLKRILQVLDNPHCKLLQRRNLVGAFLTLIP